MEAFPKKCLSVHQLIFTHLKDYLRRRFWSVVNPMWNNNNGPDGRLETQATNAPHYVPASSVMVRTHYSLQKWHPGTVTKPIRNHHEVEVNGNMHKPHVVQLQPYLSQKVGPPTPPLQPPLGVNSSKGDQQARVPESPVNSTPPTHYLCQSRTGPLMVFH